MSDGRSSYTFRGRTPPPTMEKDDNKPCIKFHKGGSGVTFCFAYFIGKKKTITPPPPIQKNVLSLPWYDCHFENEQSL